LYCNSLYTIVMASAASPDGTVQEVVITVTQSGHRDSEGDLEGNGSTNVEEPLQRSYRILVSNPNTVYSWRLSRVDDESSLTLCCSTLVCLALILVIVVLIGPSW
jgi:hypothetical protein